MMLERTGVVADAIAIRQRYARHMWRPPVVRDPPRRPLPEVPAPLRSMLCAVADILAEGKGTRPSARDAIVAACEAFDCPRDLVIGHRRNAWIVRARHAVFLLLREEAGMTYQAIGRVTHRDHTTVMHGIARAREHIAANGWYRERYERAVALFRGSR